MSAGYIHDCSQRGWPPFRFLHDITSQHTYPRPYRTPGQHNNSIDIARKSFERRQPYTIQFKTHNYTCHRHCTAVETCSLHMNSEYLRFVVETHFMVPFLAGDYHQGKEVNPVNSITELKHYSVIRGCRKPGQNNK